jgi:hypothetical protein
MSINGRFVWYDLMTNDVESAKAFYAETIGWTVRDRSRPKPYSIWTVGDTPIGGARELPREAAHAGVPPHWMAYVAVDDVDATAARARCPEAGIWCSPWVPPNALALSREPRENALSIWP